MTDEIVEEVIEQTAKVVKTFTRKQLFTVLGVGVVSGVGLGATSSYFLLNKRLTAKYTEIAEKEIAEARDYYRVLYKGDEYATIADAAENLLDKDALAAADAMRNYSGMSRDAAEKKENDEEKEDSDPRPPPETVVNIHNVFTNPPVVEVVQGDDNEFDYEAEMRNRGEDAPYVITDEEFMNNEQGLEQVSLTFYEEDGVLTDPQDKPIPDSDSTVGDVNLNRFGYGSKDNNIIFVRNPKTGVEFEITRSFGSYTEEVLGFKHSADTRQKIRRFRGDDE